MKFFLKHSLQTKKLSAVSNTITYQKSDRYSARSLPGRSSDLLVLERSLLDRDRQMKD